MAPQSFGDLLRAHRLTAGLTQEAVAERAGLSVHAIQKLERGVTHPYRDTALRLVAALRLSGQDEAEFKELGQPAARHRRAVGPEHGFEFPIARPELPVALTSFVGRERDVADVCKLLDEARLLTLTGVGGCGKTRLAVEAAHATSGRFADGAWLVELAQLTDAALVPQALGAVFGVREVPTQPLLATLVAALKPRRLLLVLDNCEHLLDGCARVVDALLRACPGLQVLATSRESLGLSGEVSWRVPSLPVPPMQSQPGPEAVDEYAALNLFVERGHAANAAFAVTSGNVAAIAHICQRLDGIPLALELAAVLVRGMSVDELATRLDYRFSLLTGGSRVALPRQQTLRATIDWSYQLLTPAQREVFARLSVFTGGWSLAAAEAVCAKEASATDDVLEHVLHLVDKSLVVLEENADHAQRYTLLETLRQYGREQLLASGLAATTLQRHAAYYLTLAEQAEADGSQPEAASWTEGLAVDQANFGAALDWLMAEGDVDSALRLAGVLWHLWQVRGYLHDGRHRLTALLAMPGASRPTLARAGVVHGAGALAMYQADALGARRMFKESLALYRQHGDERGAAWVLIRLAWLASDSQYIGAGRRFLAEALELCERLDDRYGISRALNVLGILTWQRGDYEAAFPLHQRSLAISRELRDRWGTAWALHRMSVALLTLVDRGGGDVRPVLPLIEEALSIWLQLGERRHFAFSLCDRGHAAAFDGRPGEARAALRQSLAIFTDLDDKHGTNYSLSTYGLVCAAERQPERALRVAAASVAYGEARAGVRRHWPAVMREFVERCELEIRATHGDAAVATAWDEGRIMSPEEVVAYVEQSDDG